MSKTFTSKNSKGQYQSWPRLLENASKDNANGWHVVSAFTGGFVLAGLIAAYKNDRNARATREYKERVEKALSHSDHLMVSVDAPVDFKGWIGK